MANKWVTLSTKERRILQRALANDELAFASNDTKNLRTKIDRLDRRIKISSAKGKGRELQRRVAIDISELTGIPFDQQDDESLIRYREMGQPGTDVVLRGQAAKAFPFSIECKCSENLDLSGSIAQAKANQRKGHDWLVIHKTRRIQETIVLLDWKTFIRIVGEGKKS